MDNFNEENAKSITFASEFLRQATEKAVDEAKRYNPSRHSKNIAGFSEPSPEELKMLGMER